MRRRVFLAAGAASAAAVATGAATGPRAASARPRRCLTVAADGSGDFSTVQAAVDAVPVDDPSAWAKGDSPAWAKGDSPAWTKGDSPAWAKGDSPAWTIKIKPGCYAGQVIVPADKPHLVLSGQGADPSRVVITDDRANGTPKPGGGTWGTSGSASVTISAAGFSARNLTFANSFDEAAHPEITGRQAVAVLTRADRLVFDNVRFLGNQDTLYVNSPDVATASRAYFRGCYVEGDVDFIFGRGTAVFDRCEIRSLDRGSTTTNGYVTAASTDTANPYGFLFVASRLTGAVAPGTVYLGRPWHPSNDPAAIAQTLFRNCFLGAHLNPAPWTDFGTWPWRDARYAEYANRGPGAGTGADRPQLTRAEAALLTPRAYLAGTDGWCPIR